MSVISESHFHSILNGLKKRQSWILIGLGFSSGLPFLLTGATLGFWLREAGISLTLIAVLSWVSLIYGMKILWAPFMDGLPIPFLSKSLGQSRALMILTQIGIFIGLILMGWVGPDPNHNIAGHLKLPFATHIAWFTAIALWVAFCAASQEIAIDGWRVQLTLSEGDQALNPTFYSIGFRIGILITDSIMLMISKRLGWPLSFEIIACAIGVGVFATLLAPKFGRHTSLIRERLGGASALIAPFNQFIQQHGKFSLLILLICALYRLPDYLIGPIATPMYQDTGLDLDAIAGLRATVGLAASLAGIAAGGGCLLLLGLRRTVLFGALAGPISNIFFAWMAHAHGAPIVFAITLIVDNFSNGIADAAIIAFMTRLVDKELAITQYALLSSTMALMGKFLKGFSGLIVDHLTLDYGLFNAYAIFFIITAILSLPTFGLCLLAAKIGIFEKRHN